MTRTADAERKAALLDAIVDYVFDRGLSDLSLRPLSVAVGTSPRVLLYYFGSKDELIARVLERLRARQLAGFAQLRERRFESPQAACRAVWEILMNPTYQPFFRLFFEVFGLAVRDRKRYSDFLDSAIADWVEFLSKPWLEAGVAADDSAAFGTFLLAGFRGLLMDACATLDYERTGRAFELFMEATKALERSRGLQ